MNRAEIRDQFFDTSEGEEDVHTTEYETAVMHEAEWYRDGMEAEMQRDGAVMKSYLKLIEEIMLQAQLTTSEGCSKPPKFNHGQCKYLADKLKQAVERAQSFLVPLIDGRSTEMSSTPKDMARFLDTCKQLYASAELVQSFIQDCCRDRWVKSALDLCNASEHVSSIVFDLELCKIVFSNVGNDRGASESSLSHWEIDKLAKCGVEMVRREALDDNRALLERIKAHCQSSESSREERLLGKRLLAALSPSAAGEGYYDDEIRSVPQIGALGDGASGVVHRGIWYESVDVAKKVLIGDDKLSQREKLIQAKLSHFNVTFLFCYGDEDQNKTTLLMDLMQGNLFDLIKKRMKRGRASPFPILVAVDIMLQVGVGMQYVHELGILHRDLKPENIFTRDVKRTEFVLTKVGDFGSAKVVEENQTMTTLMGSRGFMAPEMIELKGKLKEEYGFLEKPYHGKMKEYPYKCDIYSFAMLCFVILTGKRPFSQEPRPTLVGVQTLSGERPKWLPKWCPKNLKDLIEKCWSQDVNERPCFGDICMELRYIKYLILMAGLEKQTLDLRRPDDVRNRREGDQSFSGRESGRESSDMPWDELAPGTQEERESQFFENHKVFADLKLKQDERMARIADGAGPGFFQNMDDLVLEEKIAEGGEAEIYAARGGLVVKVMKQYSLKYLIRFFDTAFLNAFESDSHRLPPLSLIKGGTLLTDSTIGNRFGIVMGRKWGDLRMLLDWHMKKKQAEREENEIEYMDKYRIYFTEDRVFSDNQVLLMMLGIAKDMKSLHNQSPPILHRDLKAHNVLVQGRELPSLDGGFEVTVCDYGNAGVRGTGFWRAPEILSGEIIRRDYYGKELFTEKCDVYSYSMICYELVTGRIPFEEIHGRRYDIVLEGGRPVLPLDLHPEIKTLIVSCWAQDPSQRPSFNDIVDILSPLV
ncbi:hypothetical protein KC19_12G079600 [Ceratodon purpureus]|uniref:Protein kinase domain-containing protein n=1 Tax=Ceratodon purpureus TaxID=3225 RepID=A0A8T0G727_CERPU|nr:hypothetical protein KC19_12G079600 [Ceratodon purpureus]